jgi:hypothetical protein
LNPEIKLDLSFFYTKEALQVFWVQRYDLLSQINYHKYLQSMVQSKTHAFLLFCLFKAKSKFLSQLMWQIHYFLFFTVIDSEFKEIQVSFWKNNRLPISWQSMKMSCLSSLLQGQSNQIPCYFLRQSFQNVSKFLSNIPYMRGFTECEPATLRTSAKYSVQTFSIRK